ncbi:MAG TPA: hypothetical protein VH619_20005 [Verrucomicrobiae bacterium]|nr:hypothetical protein [Verrucomicrobiae bacterium]
MKNRISLTACLTALAICLAAAPGARSQSVSFIPGGHADVTGDVGNEVNPSVAINPLNPSNIFVVAISDVGGLATAATTNQGKTWSTNIIAGGADNLLQAYQYPSAAFDSFGNLYVAYLPASFLGVGVAISTNGGLNFTMLANLAAADATDTPRITAGPASAPGSVWVVYKDYSQASTPLIAQGLVAANLNVTNQFGPPALIPGSASGGFPDIAIGPTGQVMVAFQNNINASGASKIFVSVNTNTLGTNGFGAAVTVTSDALGGLTYIPAQPTGIGICASASVAFDCDPFSPYHGRAYIVYTALGNNTQIIGFRSSSNNGATWGTEKTVNDDGSINSHFMPRVAVDPITGIVACSWYDCRKDVGGGSTEVLETESASYTFSDFYATNLMAQSTGPGVNYVTNSATGTSYNITISGDNLEGSLLSTNGGADTVSLSTEAGTFFALVFTGNTGTNATGTNVVVKVTVQDTFPNAFTSGTPNQEPVMFTTISSTGGASFLPNNFVVPTNVVGTGDATVLGFTFLTSPIPPDSPVGAPVLGFGSDELNSGSRFGLGSYTGLAFFGGVFYPAWADNSDLAWANPAGPLNNFDVSIGQVSVPAADLTLTVTNSPNPVLSDGAVAYTVVAINNGPSSSTGVTIVDTLPANVSFETAVPAIGASYSVNGQVVTLTFPSLPANAALTNLILVRAGFSAYGTNIASISGPFPDPDLPNNTNILATLFAGEDLALGVTASSSNLYGGQTVTNSISVTNFGPSANGDVVITNVFSANWGQFGIVSGGWTQMPAALVPGSFAINGNTLVLNVGMLASNQTTNVQVSALALATTRNGVTAISVSSLDFDTNLVNNTGSTTATMTAEALGAGISAGSAQVGVPLTFTAVVTNFGPSSYGYIMATNVLPANFANIQVIQSPNPAIITNNTIIFPVGPIPSNGTTTLVFTAVPQSTNAASDTLKVSCFDFAPTVTASIGVASTPPSLPIENFRVIPGASGAFLVWDTPINATAQVDYGVTSAYGSVSSLGAPSTHHIVMLTGLARNTNYFFNAFSLEGGTLYSTNGTFSTITTLILNTQDATYSGLWTGSSVGNGIFNGYFQTADTTNNTPSSTATYAPNIPVSGDYDISIWYPESATFATNTPFVISGGTNELFVPVNQSINGGSWQPLASNVYFVTGITGNVIIDNDTGYTNKGVAANGMRWVYDVAQDSTPGELPAWWANFYFGTNVSGTADSDGDGYPNYAEYVFGTDPTDPTSKLSFTVTPVSGNTVTINFSPYQGGRDYQLLTTANLANPQWLALTNAATVDANGNGVFTVTETNAAGAFYELSASVSP